MAEFFRYQELAALLHGSDIGTLAIIKVPSQELVTLRGPIPIGIAHELYQHPNSPVIRTLLTFVDCPEEPLRLETFTNINDPQQHADFAVLGEQDDLPLVFYDESLKHRLTKRLRNTTAPQIPEIMATADRLLQGIPHNRRDFERAKAEIMEATRL